MTDTDHRDHRGDPEERLPYEEPVIDPPLWTPAGYNPRHDGENWWHWKLGEFTDRP